MKLLLLSLLLALASISFESSNGKTTEYVKASSYVNDNGVIDKSSIESFDDNLTPELKNRIHNLQAKYDGNSNDFFPLGFRKGPQRRVNGNPWNDILKRPRAVKNNDQLIRLQAKLFDDDNIKDSDKILNNLDFDPKHLNAQFRKREQTCNKINGMELGFIQNLQTTQVFKSSDCFCGEALFCSYSYAQPDKTSCKISSEPMSTRWSDDNCHMIRKCQMSGDCDGVAFDGSLFYKVKCEGSGVVAYDSGKNRQYLIQMVPC